MTATIYYLRPQFNATRNVTNYHCVERDDFDMPADLAQNILDYAKQRLTDAGFGGLISGLGQPELEGSSLMGDDGPEELSYVVRYHTPEGGEIGVEGMLVHNGEVSVDHGLFIDG